MRSRGDKTKEQLIGELATLRKQIADLETSEAECKRGHEKIQQQNEFLGRILDSLSYPFYVVDASDYTIRMANPAAKLETSSENPTCYALIHKSDKPCAGVGHVCPLKKVSKTKKPVVVEHIHYDEDGNTRSVEVHGHPLLDAEGNVIQMIVCTLDITERKRMERRIEHLNRLLRATYDVSHLIARERDPDKLLKSTCDSLIESRGYRHAWLLLLDGSRRVVATTEGGLGKDFSLMTEWLKRCGLTVCGKKALKQPGVVATIDPSSSCADCPLANRYDGTSALTVRLEHDGKVYGLLSCSVPNDYATDEEEQALFQTVARDISFALYSIETEKQRKRAVNTLAKLAGTFSR